MLEVWDGADEGPPVTVAELIKKLSEMPQDALVVLQKDAEGNGYDTLDDLSAVRCDEDEYEPLWNEEGDEEIAFDDESEGGIACVVLRP